MNSLFIFDHIHLYRTARSLQKEGNNIQWDINYLIDEKSFYQRAYNFFSYGSEFIRSSINNEP